MLSGCLEEIIKGRNARDFFIHLNLRPRMDEDLKIWEGECYPNLVCTSNCQSQNLPCQPEESQSKIGLYETNRCCNALERAGYSSPLFEWWLSRSEIHLISPIKEHESCFRSRWFSISTWMFESAGENPVRDNSSPSLSLSCDSCSGFHSSGWEWALL